MKDSIAFIYVHAFNGLVRVESLETARNIDGNSDWNHVSTVNAHIVLEQILRSSIKDRNQIIKHLLE